MMSHRLLIAIPLCWLLVVMQVVFAQNQYQYQEPGSLEIPVLILAEGEVAYGPDGEPIHVDLSPPSPREMALNVSMMSIMLNAYSEGRFPIHLFEDIDASGGILTSLIGLSEAQRLHIKAVMEGIEKRFEQGFEDGTANIEELSPEEFAEFKSGIFEFFSQVIDEMDTTVRETLTPLQLQLLRECELANSLEEELFGAINFDAYEALDLSEEQREELKKIREEETAQSKEDLEAFFSDAVMTMEMMEKSETRLTKVRERIREILTPEQRKRLEQLEEEIPKKLEALKAKRQNELQGEAPKAEEPWKPGPDSWKPGEPIPEHLQAPEQNRRFPFKRE